LLNPVGGKDDRTPAKVEGKAEAKAELEIFAAPPLYTLSPRMKFLEDQLADRERVRLAHEPDKLLARLDAATGSQVRVWHGKLPAVTPVRALRAYLSVAEGGLDKRGRMEYTKVQMLLSFKEAWQNYSLVGLVGRGELVPE